MHVQSLEDSFEVVDVDEPVPIIILILDCTSAVADIALAQYVFHSSIIIHT